MQQSRVEPRQTIIEPRIAHSSKQESEQDNWDTIHRHAPDRYPEILNNVNDVQLVELSNLTNDNRNFMSICSGCAETEFQLCEKLKADGIMINTIVLYDIAYANPLNEEFRAVKNRKWHARRVYVASNFCELEEILNINGYCMKLAFVMSVHVQLMSFNLRNALDNKSLFDKLSDVNTYCVADPKFFELHCGGSYEIIFDTFDAINIFRARIPCAIKSIENQKLFLRAKLTMH